MRTAADIINDYRARGYTDTRLRALANGRAEPMRTEMIELLDSDPHTQTEEASVSDVAEVVVSVQEEEKIEENFKIDSEEEILEQVETIMDDVLDASADVPDSQIIPEDSEITDELPGVEVVAEVEVTESDILEENIAEDLELDYDYVSDEKHDAHISSHSSHLEEQAQKASSFTSWEKHDQHVVAYLDAIEELEREIMEEESEVMELNSETIELVDIPKIEITAASEETQVVEEISDNIDLEEDMPEIDSLIKEALGYHPVYENSNMPKLAEIEAVYIEAKNFIDETVESLASRVIDLREDEDAFEHNLGETWPTADEVSAAEHELEPFVSVANEQEFETEDSKYREVIAAPVGEIDNDIEFIHEDEKYREVVAIPSNLHRTLEVIENAGLDINMEESAILEESNIIAFEAPYAVEIPEHAMMMDEESAIIKFPSSVQETYDAIRSILPNNGEVVFEDANDDMVDVDDLVIRIEQEMTPATTLSVGELLHMSHYNEIEAHEDNEELIEDIVEQVAEESVEEAAPMAFDGDIRSMEMVENELATMQRMLFEIEEHASMREIEVGRMKSLIETRDETMQMQNKELTQVRHELLDGMDAISEAKELERQYDDLQNDYTKASKRIVDTDRELNIVKTSTIPDLEADKNDLIDLIEDQSEKTINLQDALSSSARRAAFGFTTAAAACLLAVLMPVLHFVNGQDLEGEFAAKEATLTASIEASKEVRKQIETENAELSQKYTDVLSAYDTSKDSWSKRLSGVSKKYNDARSQLLQANAKIKRIQSGTALAAADGTPDASASNGVAGWENWGATRTAQPAKKQKTGIVRRGDGLSHVLWRECGGSNKLMIDWVISKNKLKISSRGYPIIQPNQKLILPPKTGMAFNR